MQLLKSAIDINDWDTADLIVNCMYEGQLDLTMSKPVLDSIFNAIQWLIEPLYKQIKGGINILTERFKTQSAFRLKPRVYDYYTSEEDMDC